MSAKRCIITAFIPHLGCPNDCVFCNQRKISGSLEAPTFSQLQATIREGLERNRGRENIQLAFYGGSFTAIPLEEQTELLEGALPFLNSGEIASLRLSTRPDSIDGHTLERLKNYGVTTIELGAQSMDKEVLAQTKRGHTPEDTVRASRQIKAAGFELILQMMTGLPGDTKEKSLETARKIAELNPDGVRIYPTVIIKDTSLADMWQAGVYSAHTVEEAVDWCVEVVEIFDAANVPVIRLGLNPSDELSTSAALGGAYHPAFGELVRSRQLLGLARAILQCEKPEGRAVFGVHPSDVSAMIGQHRTNALSLETEFAPLTVKVQGTNVKKGEVILMNFTCKTG